MRSWFPELKTVHLLNVEIAYKKSFFQDSTGTGSLQTDGKPIRTWLILVYNKGSRASKPANGNWRVRSPKRELAPVVGSGISAWRSLERVPSDECSLMMRKAVGLCSEFARLDLFDLAKQIDDRRRREPQVVLVSDDLDRVKYPSTPLRALDPDSPKLTPRKMTPVLFKIFHVTSSCNGTEHIISVGAAAVQDPSLIVMRIRQQLLFIRRVWKRKGWLRE
ncbi:hypothetical protein GALMADRAFT_216237 [Galerina marginata CBS 339.88]|uniref:Uncharacterized protein n=1 Tax=Galerina marginata (strain CBS 339.88) TaxID=685588 RepID=A0A067SAG5_GALM3|nr:hypothetical protein GALMADRAFT_216237 [Galerina marginata CBS 339.88]